MKITDPPVIVSQTFDLSKDELWKVITELNHMREWFFDSIPAFNAMEGFETLFTLSTGEREFEHVWKIVEVQSGSKIVYDWSYTGYQGRGLVTFELEEKEEKTKLTLTNTTTEDWQDDIPEFKRESSEGGWDYFINQSLKKYIAEM